ncbi:hypothetical protein TCSYLVIO_009921, partial [Trypanosoma cruzi]
SSILVEMVNFTSCVRLSLSSASRRASVGTCVSTPFGTPLAGGVILCFSFIVPTLPKREHTFVKRLSNGLQRLVRSQVKNLFRKPLVLYVTIRLPNKHLHRHIVVFHQRPPCRQHNSKGNHSVSCWCCSWSTAATLYSPPHVELQRRKHRRRCHGEAPSQHPCSKASHSHRPTAASRCRWLKRTVAAVSSRCPNSVGRGTRTAEWSVRHAAALQRLSVKQSRPTAPQQRNVQPTPTPPHYRPFSFCFVHVVGLFALSPTAKKVYNFT